MTTTRTTPQHDLIEQCEWIHYGGGEVWTYEGKSGRHVASFGSNYEAADAAVREHNTHAALVEALRECAAILKKPSDWGGANLAETNGGQLALQHAASALAAAKGTK